VFSHGKSYAARPGPENSLKVLILDSEAQEYLLEDNSMLTLKKCTPHNRSMKSKIFMVS
jgi:hypothetical protein